MTLEIHLGVDLVAFLDQQLEDVVGQVVSNLVYMLALEYGHSKQAPEGMVGEYIDEYRDLLRDELMAAIKANPTDMDRAIKAAVSTATLGAARAIADRTPVDTGRAKGSWVAMPPVGREQVFGPRMDAEEQQEIRARRREKATNVRKKAQARAAATRERIAERERAAAAKPAKRKTRRRRTPPVER